MSSVLTPAGEIQANLTIEAGTIVEITPGTGRSRHEIVAPGFVDLQVNGVDDVDCSDAGPDDWRRAGTVLAATGVTAWLPTLVSQPLDRYGPELGAIATAMRRPDPGPVILGAHLEGPFLGGSPGAHATEAIVPVDLPWLRALPDTVRLVTLAPEQGEAIAAVALLRDHGVVVSLGHSDADLATTLAAIDAGATMVTHLFNAMGPLHHRAPGMAGAALADDRVFVGLIADLVHVHPALLRVAYRTKGAERVALVTDAVGWRAGRLAALDIAVVNGAPRLADGTLAGSALTMDQAVRNLVDAAGVEPADAVRSASTTPADVLGDRSRGRIEPGARADLVVLDRDSLAVLRTIVDGRTVWEA